MSPIISLGQNVANYTSQKTNRVELRALEVLARMAHPDKNRRHDAKTTFALLRLCKEALGKPGRMSIVYAGPGRNCQRNLGLGFTGLQRKAQPSLEEAKLKAYRAIEAKTSRTLAGHQSTGHIAPLLMSTSRAANRGTEG